MHASISKSQLCIIRIHILYSYYMYFVVMTIYHMFAYLIDSYAFDHGRVYIKYVPDDTTR